MLLSPSSALLTLLLLVSPPNEPGQAPLPTCAEGVRHIELEEGAARQVYEVCIRSEFATSLFIDAKVLWVELAGRERFRLLLGSEGLTLLPVGAFLPGERLPLTVYFGEAGAPESVTFLLVVHPTEAERQVVVSHHSRTLASYRQGEQRALEEAWRCQEEKALLLAECNGEGGLTGLISHRLMGKGGVLSQDISDSVTLRPGSALKAWQVVSYRTVGPDGRRGRVAVAMKLWNQGTTRWTPREAVLRGPLGEVLGTPRVWPRKPIPPGEPLEIVMEMDATELEARGSFTLELLGGEGEPGVRIEGVKFP